MSSPATIINKNEVRNSLIIHAAYEGSAELLQSLLRGIILSPKMRANALLAAVERKRDVEILTTLLKNGDGNLGDRIHGIFFRALSNGHSQVLEKAFNFVYGAIVNQATQTE